MVKGSAPSTASGTDADTDSIPDSTIGGTTDDQAGRGEASPGKMF